MATVDFDATTVEPSAPRDLIPAGTYLMQIVASDLKTTKAGDGQYLELQLDILEGPHAGRKLWDRLNLVSRTQQAVDIARRTFSAICHAVGVLQIRDSEQLHFRPLLVTVKVKPAGPDKRGVHREARNEIAGYVAASGRGTPPRTPAPSAGATQPASRGMENTPWRKTG